MIQKVKAFIAKDVMSVEQMAEALHVTNYNAIHRNGYTIVVATDSAGDRVSIVCGPYVVSKSLYGARKLLEAGFSETDMCLALGMHRREYADMLKRERAEKKKAEQAANQSPRRGTSISLDDL